MRVAGELPLKPILTEQFRRVRRADGAISTAQGISWTILVASPADAFGLLREDGNLNHSGLS